MLRNFLVAGIVSSLMGVFVLSFQALTPKDTQPKMPVNSAKGAVGEQNGMNKEKSGQQKEPPMKDGQPDSAGSKMAEKSGQKKQDMANGQMQSPGMGMMGMCGRMMKMMMGGKMK